ncbi:uncharacterized protein LOC109502001 [Felis catus]|uniref:uncharacterized protein LOC109502001 n=1 Tax=Felis catus TaxID=9685 RepID=UPI001D19E014|nr:uncharacterized protein LOC109502001 [Felis catus]XP_044918466.1 uncharacterized protein LOC109502001 [Felis catus]XP_044918467.1 uncharacterized protein LOC109502001 [Felis catus]
MRSYGISETQREGVTQNQTPPLQLQGRPSRIRLLPGPPRPGSGPRLCSDPTPGHRPALQTLRPPETVGKVPPAGDSPPVHLVGGPLRPLCPHTWSLIVPAPLGVRVPSGAEKTTGALQTDKWTHSLTTLPSLCRPPSPPLLPGRRAFSGLETEAASRCEVSFHSFATREGSPQRSRQAGHRAPGAGKWVPDGPERTIVRGRAECGSLLSCVLKVSPSRGCEGTTGLWAFTASPQASPTRPPYACLPLAWGWGRERTERPFLYFILFYFTFSPICKITPSESTVPPGSSTKFENIQLKTWEQPSGGWG